jgi:hypothetical protein
MPCTAHQGHRGGPRRDLAAAAQSGPLTPERMGPIASRYDDEPA